MANGSGAAIFDVVGVVSTGHAQFKFTCAGPIWTAGLLATPRCMLVRATLGGELMPSTIAAATAPAALTAVRLRNTDIREEWERPIIIPQISQKEHAVRMLTCRAYAYFYFSPSAKKTPGTAITADAKAVFRRKSRRNEHG